MIDRHAREKMGGRIFECIKVVHRGGKQAGQTFGWFCDDNCLTALTSE
jgi:hypothetical protein